MKNGLKKIMLIKILLSILKIEKIISFLWSMIDKITPRPSENVAKSHEKLYIENMNVIITNKKNIYLLLL